MKKFLLTTTALAGMTAGAFAADLPRRAAPPVFAPVPPAFTWTGFYVGVNAGYGFSNGNGNNANQVFVPAGTFGGGFGGTTGTFTSNNRTSRDGFVGGGQIGYNYQFTPGSGFVIGVEADIQYTDFGRSRNNVGATFVGTGALPPGFVLAQNQVRRSDFFGSVRGRLGYAFNTVLVYGTGGFAYDENNTGYAAGGGVEFALPTNSFLNFFNSSAVTFKIEGLYVSMDRDRDNGQLGFLGNGTPVFLANNDTRGRNNDFTVVRAGINYKF